MARYDELAQTEPYGATALPPYDPDQWMDEVVNEDVRGFRDRSD
ncbi:MAG: hypothetical protein U5R49_07150 [Deltaproteobacteria bacterium]|nr:hypothetical protein [Deltaproteobacteria bacterium]